MAKCKNCKHMIYQKVVFNYTTTEYPYCPAVEECLDDIDKEIICSGFKGITNADRIRSMADEELAEFLCRYDVCSICSHNNCKLLNCDKIGITERWLKSEVGCK